MDRELIIFRDGERIGSFRSVHPCPDGTFFARQAFSFGTPIGRGDLLSVRDVRLGQEGQYEAGSMDMVVTRVGNRIVLDEEQGLSLYYDMEMA